METGYERYPGPMTPDPLPAPIDQLGDGRVSLHVVPSDLDPYSPEALSAAIRQLGSSLQWADGRGAFGSAVSPGARVLVKPNWVMHENKGPWGLEPLITHFALIKQVVEELLLSDAGEVVVGDAPLQSCDLDALLAWGDMREWAAKLQRRDPRFLGVRDFRRTRSTLQGGVLERVENVLGLEDFVLFDLASESMLEPVSSDRNIFRVTQYDPRLMAATHVAGRHRYLIARDVLDADVVVNLPKLKTHKKAGMTCALKNLVGINGNKEFLPHHRVGGRATGGDSYPGRSVLKRCYELTLDAGNMAKTRWLARLINLPARVLSVLSLATVDQIGAEGAWSGNDTVWRMCLDLNRILLYGRVDATLAETPQRLVLHVVDAGMAAQGDGPLAPEPFPLRVFLAGNNAAAVDVIGAELLGYSPALIPIVNGAFGNFRWPLASFSRDRVTTVGSGSSALGEGSLPKPHVYPIGWLDTVDPRRDRSDYSGKFFRPWQAKESEPA